ncbi:MAG TPA: hypothetical protein VFY81_01545 [Gammaproteobacteria bacterium]|nr:hypothetical protein [Gammaproteobacteria bacterium]
MTDNDDSTAGDSALAEIKRIIDRHFAEYVALGPSEEQEPAGFARYLAEEYGWQIEGERQPLTPPIEPPLNRKTEATRRIRIEGAVYEVPGWIRWIAKEEGGEYTGFEDRPLCKKPYGFWKAQGSKEGHDICIGTPIDAGAEWMPDVVERHLWRVEHFAEAE